MLVVAPAEPLAPEAFFTTDLSVLPVRIIEWFVSRWSIEATFAEVRRHLGVETQRQWSAKAIARTTPALLALFSIVCWMVHRLRDHWASLPRSTAWYLKPQATCSDCLALVRRTIWAEGNDVHSLADQVVISRPAWERVLAQLAATA